jgi:competence protein ComEC
VNGLVLVAPAFAAGMLLLQRQAELPHAGWATLLVLMALAAVLVAARAASRNAARTAVRAAAPGIAVRPLAVRTVPFALTVVIAFGGGFGWAALRAELALSDALDRQWEGRDISVTGVIASLPQPFERGVRFDFDIEAALFPGVLPASLPASQPGALLEPNGQGVPSAAMRDSPAGIPSRVSLAWYNGLSPEEFQEVQPVRAGERWRFTVRLRRPHGSVNPHGFDYEAWLLERGIRATGYVRPARAGVASVTGVTGEGGGTRRLDDLVLRPGYLLERLREQLRARLWQALAEGRHAGILIALAIGDQRAIEADEWQVFARTGVSHLMSISGLHVTMVSGLFGFLVLWLWRRVPPLALRWPAQKAGAVAAAVAALLYCLLSGFAVPAQRTLYMVTVVAVALVLDRMTAASRVLALALFVVLLLDPWAVIAPGFWLSFGAVAVIFHVGANRPRVEARAEALRSRLMATLANWGVVQWAVTVGLVPLLLLLFGQVSVVSPIANAIAIPVVSFVITPLALAGALLPIDALLLLADWVTAQLMPLLEWLSDLDGAVWQQHAPAWWTLLPAVLGILWLLAPRGFPARPLGVVLLLPMFAIAPAGPGRGEAWLTVFDVGQGLAVLVRTERHALLYDAGPMWSPQADSGSRVILPYLRGEGIGSLDVLAVSHDDNDHSGGAGSVAAALPVARFVSSMSMSELPAAWGANRLPYRQPCRSGQAWAWDGVQFEWLHPGGAGQAEQLAEPRVSPNDRSCVLRVGTAHGTALLAGDIEKGSERVLLARHGSDGKLAADMLSVPHHGSGTSSTPEFVEAVSPRVAVFSVGYRNRFGHPRADVWARYADAERVRTDEAGAVGIRFADGRMALQQARINNRRYWHGR